MKELTSPVDIVTTRPAPALRRRRTNPLYILIVSDTGVLVTFLTQSVRLTVGTVATGITSNSKSEN